MGGRDAYLSNTPPHVHSQLRQGHSTGPLLAELILPVNRTTHASDSVLLPMS